MNGKYVFISYKVEEYDVAKAVKDHLEANAIPCWMAPMSIKGGMSYAQEIPPAIQNSGAFLLILSKKAQESKWVPKEVDQAINCEKLILPYMVENCPLRSDFSFYLTNVQRYEAFRDPEETLHRMTRDIQNALGITPPEVQTAVEKPDAVSEKPPVKKVVKKVAKKEKRAGTGKKIPLWALASVVLPVIALLIFLLVPQKIGIAGVSFQENESSLALENKTLTQTDVNRFADFTNLEFIALSNCVLDATDLSPLTQGNLMSLSLVNCGLTNETFSSLDLPVYLNALNVGSNPKLTELKGLSVCADTLTRLDISDTGITAFDWLSDYPNLVALGANRTGLQPANLPASMIYLQELYLSGNEIVSLDGLKNVSQLSIADLSHNQLTDVSVLSRSADHLSVLHLEHNALTDLSSLASTKNLTVVSVDENRLTDLNWLKNNKELRFLSASHNRIESISGLGIGEKMTHLDLSHNALQSVSTGDLNLGEKYPVSLYLYNNDLQTLDLSKNCHFKNLVLLENPRLDLSELLDVKGQDLYLNFSEDTELQTLKKFLFDKLCITGCTLERQAELEGTLSNEELLTLEQALEKIEQVKENEKQ